ncbi:MAG: CBS domain-containing protein [Fibrobacterota bacterium]
MNETEKMVQKTLNKKESEWPRFTIALVVVLVGYTIISVVSFKSVGNGDMTGDEVLDVILPVIAAWTGAVVAFYFSQKNTDSANRTVDRLVEKLTPEQRLASTPGVTCMIPLERMEYYKKEKNDIKLIKLNSEILGKMKKIKQNRLPVLDNRNRVHLIIHRSMIDRFFAQKFIENYQSSKDNLNVGHLKNDEEIWPIISKGMAFVRPSDTMADAKREMERTKNCLDVFVTSNGKQDGEVIGWITNGRITECAQA